MFFIFTKSHNFKSPCRATSTFKKYLRKPINSYNDINNIFVNANLLLCFPQAQPGGTVKGQHGSSGFRHMGTFNGKQQLLLSSYPRYTHTPRSIPGAHLPLDGGSWAEPRWWLPAWSGFCSRGLAAPSHPGRQHPDPHSSANPTHAVPTFDTSTVDNFLSDF